MKTITENNKVIRYYSDYGSTVIGVVNTYESIKERLFNVQYRINKLLVKGLIPSNMFYLIDKKEMYISILKRIADVYCLRPF